MSDGFASYDRIVCVDFSEDGVILKATCSVGRTRQNC